MNFPINIKNLFKSTFFTRISLFRQLRYDLKFKEKYLDMKATRRAYLRHIGIKYIYMRIFNFTSAKFFIPFNLRTMKSKSILRKYVYYKYPMTKTAGFVGPEWEHLYKPYAERLVQHRIMGARVFDHKMNMQFNVIYALDLPPDLLALAKKTYSRKTHKTPRLARFYSTDANQRVTISYEVQKQLSKVLDKHTRKPLLKSKKKQEEQAFKREIYMQYAEPETPKLKFKPGVYFWHNQNKFWIVKNQNKLRFQNAVGSYIKSVTFPRTKDKSYLKKNKKLLPFNKLLQREIANLFLKGLGKHFKFLKLKLNNLGRGFRLKRKPQKYFPKLSYINRFIFLWQFTIFGFLSKILSFNFKFVLGLIKQGYVYVNGQQVFDPFHYIDKLNIIHLDFPYSFYPLIELVAWKFSNIKFNSILKTTYFKKFAPPFNLEVNYKTIEFLVLPSSFDPRELRNNYLNVQSILPVLFSQWFFPKQKYFGLGRNI